MREPPGFDLLSLRRTGSLRNDGLSGTIAWVGWGVLVYIRMCICCGRGGVLLIVRVGCGIPGLVLLCATVPSPLGAFLASIGDGAFVGVEGLLRGHWIMSERYGCFRFALRGYGWCAYADYLCVCLCFHFALLLRTGSCQQG
ncbi:hypothetical protein, unlikely [Trypanosoma brucei gambiense DAL972]|uniref:Uncharacterized protein n=1 Tax=Trypanosoma brucei gambiense (strain MHOM/CI/86/DAL972) TaxID=679716 RepID=C9ZS24_TRYB9|nr:hypothetical protein, unlikely [Trypanosoma brucei gambiense DAL972]CBH12160.1 hypothetical protein, unlikely [Trypanosoma brucei gambiense DAL972]|eukprot:XP_011774443.1 hypothetical protein, unlikely [Trypanosoma brucei gambiense DAL972]